MARTVGEAIILLKKSPSYRDLQDQGFAGDAAQQALDMMWNAYGWPGSEVELPPFYLTPYYPDYPQPIITLPTDYAFLIDAWMREVPSRTHELTIRRTLPISTYSAKPTSISYQPEKSAFRLHPTPGTGQAAPNWQVEGVYKKKLTDVTGANLVSQNLPFDDRFFHVYVAALKYMYAYILNHPDAGRVQVSGGFPIRTGLLGSFYAALEDAISNEVSASGYEGVHPENPIMLG